MLPQKIPAVTTGAGLRALPIRRRAVRSDVAARAVLPDWHHFSALEQLQHLHLLSLADVEVPDVSAVAPAVTEAVAKTDGAGPFDWLAHVFEWMLTAIDGGLEQIHVPYSYGFAIITLTIIVKIATYPLSQKQVESTLATQALQPRVKALQAKYVEDKDALNVEIARLYKQANVNPLAGCLPTLATIPVFIGLYRALTLAASDGLLKEGFFFIPSLAGPTSVEAQLANQGMQWLFPFVDGQPPLGWEDTAKYLALPVLLVISQYVSMAISTPKTDDPQMQQTQRILRFLPIMIGWFSLNVPSGLCVYWLTNNIITTAQLAYLRKVTKVDLPVAAAAGGSRGAGQVIDVSPSAEAASEVALRRSRKGETFRARGANKTGAVSVVREAKQKRKGIKFKQRKADPGVAAVAGGAPVADAPGHASKSGEAESSSNGNAPREVAAKPAEVASKATEAVTKAAEAVSKPAEVVGKTGGDQAKAPKAQEKAEVSRSTDA